MRTGIFRGTWYNAPGVYARVPNIVSVALVTMHWRLRGEAAG